MPLTPEQIRLRELFVNNNPLANRQLPQTGEAAPVYSPTDYNVQKSSNPSADYGQVGLATENMKPRDAYQTQIRNRFQGIAGIGQEATARAMAAAQARQQAEAALINQGGGAGYGDTGSYKGAKTGNAERDFLMGLVAKQKGMPYSWGGGNSKGPSYGLSGGGERHNSSKIYGFDCSGLVQYAYAQIGIKMPRLAGQQMAMGTRIPLSKAMAGDLVGKPGHIAIYAGNGMMWEAPTFGKQVRLVPVRAGMFAVHVKGVG